MITRIVPSVLAVGVLVFQVILTPSTYAGDWTRTSTTSLGPNTSLAWVSPDILVQYHFEHGIMRSTSGGKDFVDVSTTLSNVRHMVSVGSVMYAVGDGPQGNGLYSSADGALSFELVAASTEATGRFRRVIVDSARLILLTSTDQLLITVDQGATFSSVTSPAAIRVPMDADVRGTTWVLNASGKTALSTDDGQSWQVLPIPPGTYGGHAVRIAGGRVILGTNNGAFVYEDGEWTAVTGIPVGIQVTIGDLQTLGDDCYLIVAPFAITMSVHRLSAGSTTCTLVGRLTFHEVTRSQVDMLRPTPRGVYLHYVGTERSEPGVYFAASSTTSVSESGNPTTKMTIAPQPANDVVTLVCSEAVSISIVDPLGRTVYAATQPARHHEVNVSEWARGMYTVLTSTGMVHRMVK